MNFQNVTRNLNLNLILLKSHFKITIQITSNKFFFFFNDNNINNLFETNVSNQDHLINQVLFIFRNDSTFFFKQKEIIIKCFSNNTCHQGDASFNVSVHCLPS